VTPLVNAAIWALRPDFAACSIEVRGGRNEPTVGACALSPVMPRPVWADGHMAAWRDAYKAFGARPQRTPCSAEALWRRLQRDGALASINAIVDLYNAVSVRFAVPVGGEDLSAYVGVPRLVRASGDESFETVREGQPVVETAEAGEVVWRDDKGVTCRRWNWRQTPRTRLDVTSTDMWFVLERLEPMPIEALLEAGAVLVEGVRRLAPHAQITQTLVSRTSSGQERLPSKQPI
jgi:DNA/RNA-binding domain of Phe-tRNA-synthetase-like protein